MLKITKKGDKYWLFEDSEIGLFSPSKFTINLLNNVITIVYENGLKSKRYNVSDCEIYDLGATSPFTTSSGNAFMEELENLNCPCFQKNENIFNISGGAWGDITGDLSNQTDLQTALDSKLDKDTTAGVERVYIINADGSQDTKATSEFGGVTSVTGDSVDNTNPLNPIINAIPLSGTTEGNPVTGDIEIDNFIGIISKSVSEDCISKVISEDGALNMSSSSILSGLGSKITIYKDYTSIDNNLPSSRGLVGDRDFTPYITDLDYTQKKYVDTKVDKVSTAGVERAYIINADGSQDTKATSEFKDVLEFADLASFPVTGESGKIYVALDTNKTYRWSGSAYVQIGNVPEVEQQLQRYWYSMTANTLNTTLMLVNNTNSFTISGTAAVVPRSGTNYYNSIAMNNYISATANGSNCGIKNNNQGDGSYLEGFDSSFVFINNDINVNCETTVGYYGLLSAIPNIAKSAYTADFTGVGNDVGDTNLSFYCKRNTETPSYTKVDCGANFPAHTTTDAYILRMQMTRGFNNSGRTLKMTITNIITGAVFSHTFTDSQIPSSTRNICMVVNRSNRNTGVATNIRFSKWHQTKYIY